MLLVAVDEGNFNDKSSIPMPQHTDVSTHHKQKPLQNFPTTRDMRHLTLTH